MDVRPLQKWHGAGNDFLIDVTDASGARWWTSARASRVCDRHRGVGADGLIVADRSTSPLTMTLYNADGSVAEVSGNGLRCLAAAVEHAGGEAVTVVLTGAGERVVHVELHGADGDGEVEMGDVDFGSDGWPDTVVPGVRVLGRVRVGNPHVVVHDDLTWRDEDRMRIAREVTGGDLSANVEFATVVSRTQIDIVVVERGVGWTLACGTGSVATAAVLHAAGEVDGDVTIGNPGGELRVRLDGARATLGGPVRHVADLTWSAR